MNKTCYCSQELEETLENLKGTSAGLRPAVKHLCPLLGQCNKLAIDSSSQSPIHTSILLPEMTAANLNSWCTAVILEAAFLNQKSPLAWGKYTQTRTKHRQSSGLSGCQQQLSVAHVWEAKQIQEHFLTGQHIWSVSHDFPSSITTKFQYRVVVQRPSGKSWIMNSLQALGRIFPDCFPKEQPAGLMTRLPLKQGRADVKYSQAARELACHSPNPRELEMLSCIPVGGTLPHACASGLSTRHARPYSSPHVLTLPATSLVLQPLVPASSASVLQITKCHFCYLKGENATEREWERISSVSFWTTRSHL